MGAPFTADPRNSRAAILGMPFDHGTHPTRIGARLGPSAIREQSALVRPIDAMSDIDVLRTLNMVDCGDAPVTPGRVEDSFAAMERATAAILDAGAVPVTMGGDGMVSLPQLRAVARKHPDLAVVHIDAHTDAYPLEGFNTATTFFRAAEEGLVDTTRSYHIGARGHVMVPGVYAHARDLGYHLITLAELRQRGIAAVLAEIGERLAGRPVYLCFDMDFFDPSVAPGVCTPSWGGATTAEGFELIAALAGLNFVAFDTNTVSPPHDTGGMTALLAAEVMFRFLLTLAQAA
jgi:agmatinase